MAKSRQQNTPSSNSSSKSSPDYLLIRMVKGAKGDRTHDTDTDND